MYPCNYPNCEETFENHTFLMNHILRDHGQSRVNWNQGIVAIIAAVIIALAMLRPVSAQDAPAPQPTPSISTPLTMLHLVYLPLVANGDSVKAAVSWCPSCRG